MKTLSAALAVSYLSALALGADAAMPPRAMTEAVEVVDTGEDE